MLKKTPRRAFRTAIIAGIVSLSTSFVCMAGFAAATIGGYTTLWDTASCTYIGNYLYRCTSAVQLEPIRMESPNLPPPFNSNCPGNARRYGSVTIGAYSSFRARTGWVC
jgi:hypothetical protein